MSDRAPPCVLVIFGASGDLAQRKLLPSLYHLERSQLLSEKFAVIGTARSPLSTVDYRRQMKEALEKSIDKNDRDEATLDRLVNRLEYFAMDSTQSNDYSRFKEVLRKQTQKTGSEVGAEVWKSENILFYLATPPSLFSEIPKRLAEQGLLEETSGWRRIIFEKPFGTDLLSAKKINHDLLEIMSESQIYRIDHYLGKETVQNLLVLRLANGIFEPTWNRRYIDSVQITVAEKLGVEERGAYYDHSGAMRDMVPNHLFQIMSLIGMEPPNSFRADDVRDEKVKLLRAIRPFSSSEDIKRRVIRGQYEGYRKEKNVDAASPTETFVALKLEVGNWRWAGVPFYLQTGKRMDKHETQVRIKFKSAPLQMFDCGGCDEVQGNELILQIQPEEKISLCFQVKKPGPEVTLTPMSLDFNYASAFGKSALTGYETLIYDCMMGDPSLFMRADQVEAAWAVVQPVLDAWKSGRSSQLKAYVQGSGGPDISAVTALGLTGKEEAA